MSVVRCLLVDDLEENLVALRALLERDDVEILCARSGAEALDLLLAHEMALAIIDVQMPEMDGFELAELMRGSERTRHVPIIFATAGLRDQHRLFKGYELGAVDFLYKPFDPHILANKAEVFFELYRQKQLLQQELRERTEALRLNEMFAAILGHDLRTPLGAILSGAQLLQARSDDEVVQRVAGRMLSSGTRMARLIEDLLDVTRARLAGGIPIVRAHADLGAILQRVVQEQNGAHPGAHIDVEADGDMTGEWDAERLAQVLSNLIGNALQHGTPGEPVCVRVDGTRSDAVIASVTNAGEIAPHVLPRLFDPFRRSESATGRQPGLGLGLYIAQQIVPAHGGTVRVQAAPGADVTFSVTVPRADVGSLAV